MGRNGHKYWLETEPPTRAFHSGWYFRTRRPRLLVWIGEVGASTQGRLAVRERNKVLGLRMPQAGAWAK